MMISKTPDSKWLPYVILSAVLLITDLTVYMLDFLMVINRWEFVMALRYILNSISITLSVIIQVYFFESAYSDKQGDADAFSLQRNSVLWLLAVIIYAYVSYIIYAVLNTLMYFQIYEDIHAE